MVQNLPNNNQTTNLSQLLSLLKRDPMRPIWLTFTWARILYLKDVQMSMGRWLDKRGLGEISRFWNFDYTALGIWDSLSWVNFRLKWAQRQRKSKLTLGLNSVDNPYHQQHSMEEGGGALFKVKEPVNRTLRLNAMVSWWNAAAK